MKNIEESEFNLLKSDIDFFKEKNTRWKVYLFILVFIFIFSLLALFIYDSYQKYELIGQDECNKRGFNYNSVHSENKELTIFCKDNLVQLIKIDGEWERIS